MQVVPRRNCYQVGEDAAVHLQAPFTGTAMVTTATDRVPRPGRSICRPEGKTIHVEVIRPGRWGLMCW